MALTQIEKSPTWGWAFETLRHDTTRQASLYSGGGTNTSYALAEKIHGLLERAGSALRHNRACVVTRRRSGARPRRCPTPRAAIRGCRRDSCFARTRGEARARTHTSPARGAAASLAARTRWRARERAGRGAPSSGCRAFACVRPMSPYAPIIRRIRSLRRRIFARSRGIGRILYVGEEHPIPAGFS